MITAQLTPEEMNAWVARFQPGRRWMPLMAPAGLASHAGAAVEALPGAAVSVVQLGPGESTLEWRYRARTEHVMCIEGEFELSHGSSRMTLRRFDLVSVPADLLHAFRNVSDRPGRLLVFTQLHRGLADEMAFDGGEALEPTVSRASDRVPYQKSLEDRDGLPGEVMKFMASSRGVYPIVVPPNVQGRNRNAPIRGLPGSSVSLIECAPGDGPQPHAHTDTREIFLCVEGRFDIVWGDRNEHRLTLKALDMVSVPPTVMRLFRSSGTGTGWLMVIIQGDDDMTDAIKSFPELAVEVERRFGRPTVETITRVIKQTFDAVPGSVAG